jgi:hypothetical protein
MKETVKAIPPVNDCFVALVFKNSLCYEHRYLAEQMVSIKGVSFGKQSCLPVDDDNENYSPGSS